MSQRPMCIDCGASAPDTNTNYTLISTSFGWRLTRRKLPSGGVSIEWRCAACWRKYKTRPAGPADDAAAAVLPSKVAVSRAAAPQPKGSSSSSPPPAAR